MTDQNIKAPQTPEEIKAQQSASRQAAKAAKAPSKPKAPSKAPALNPAAIGTTPTKVDAKGMPLLCMVLVKGRQCQNPARHDHGQGKWSCSTHLLSALRGRALWAKGHAPLKASYVSPTQQALAAAEALSKAPKAPSKAPKA